MNTSVYSPSISLDAVKLFSKSKIQCLTRQPYEDLNCTTKTHRSMNSVL